MSRTQANLLLLLAAAIWGVTFVVQQSAAQLVGPNAFTAARFLLGALVVAPLALRERRRLAAQGRELGRRDLGGILVTGAALALGAVLQQVGIGLTSVTNASFLTALYVPLVPIIALLVLKVWPHPVVWPAAAACLAGSWLLSGAGRVEMAAGDLWVIASALFWAVHMLLVGAVASRTGAPMQVAAGQFLGCALLTGLWSAATEPLALAGLVQVWPQIAYAGLLSVGVAFTAQVAAQRFTLPSDAAVLMSSEAVFAAAAGALLLGERLDGAGMAGCALILVSVLAVQLAPERRRPSDVLAGE